MSTSKERMDEIYLFFRENWGGIIFTIIIVTGFFLLFYFRNYYVEFISDNYKCKTAAYVLAFEPETKISQSMIGNSVVTWAFSVTYKYQINDSIFNGKQIVENIAANKKLINEISSDINSKRLQVKYNCNSPEKVILIVNE